MAGILHGNSQQLKYLLLVERPLPRERKPWSSPAMVRYLRLVFGVDKDESARPRLPDGVGVVSLLPDAFSEFTLKNVELHVPKLKRVLSELPHLQIVYGTTPRLTTLVRCAFDARQAYGYARAAPVSDRTMSVDGAEFGNGALISEYRAERDWLLEKKDMRLSYIPGVRAFHYAPLMCPTHAYRHARRAIRDTLGKPVPFRLDKLLTETARDEPHTLAFALAMVARSKAVSLIRSQIALTRKYHGKFVKAVRDRMVRPLTEFSTRPILASDFDCDFASEGKTPTSLQNFGERVRDCEVTKRFMHLVPNNAAAEHDAADFCLTNWEYDQTDNRFFLYGVSPNHYTATISLSNVRHRFYIEPTAQLDEILGLSTNGPCVFAADPGRYCEELSGFLRDGLCELFEHKRRTPEHALDAVMEGPASLAFKVSVATDKRWTHAGFKPAGKTVLQVEAWHYNAVEDAYAVLKAAHLDWDRDNAARKHRQCPLNIGERTLSAREQLSIFYGIRASHWTRFPAGSVAFRPLGDHSGRGAKYGLQVFGKCAQPRRIEVLTSADDVPLKPLRFTREYMLGSFPVGEDPGTFAKTSADQPGMVNFGFDIECCALPFAPDGSKRKSRFPDPRFDGVITIGTAVEMQHKRSEYRKDQAYISRDYPSRVIFQLGTVDEDALEHVPDDCPEDLREQIRRHPTRCYQFESEADLLACFFLFYKAVLPSVDVTHNGNIFDWKYLVERARVLGVFSTVDSLGFNPHRCVRHLERTFVSRAYGEKVINTYAGRDGVVGVDTYDTYTREKKEPSYKLDALAGKYLKLGKDDMPYSAIYGYQASGARGRALIAKYCVRDAQLPLQLCNHSKWITNMVAFARVCGTVECARMYTAGAQEKVLGVMNWVNQTRERGIIFYDPCNYVKQRNLAIERRRYARALAARGYVFVDTEESKEAARTQQKMIDRAARDNEVRSGMADPMDVDEEEEPAEMKDDEAPVKAEAGASAQAQDTLDRYTESAQKRLEFVEGCLRKMNLGEVDRAKIKPGMRLVLPSGKTHTLTEREAAAVRYSHDEFKQIEKRAREAREARLRRGALGQAGNADDVDPDEAALEEIYQHLDAICGLAEGDAASVLSRTEVAYKGAVVLKPRSGLLTRLPVLCLDFASLYPSLAMEYNISFDTILYESDFLVRDYTLADGTLLKKEDCWLSPDQGVNPLTERVENVYFVKEAVWRGLVPLMEEILKRTRSATKRTMAGYAAKIKVDGQWVDNPDADAVLEAVMDGKQLAEKLIMNATYGFLGAEGKASNKNCAAAITGFGRVEIMKVKNHCKLKFGARRDGGDTDSVFMEFPGLPEGHPDKGTKWDLRIETVSQAEAAAEFLEEEINSISGPYIIIEYEKSYDPVVFTTKKRYNSLKHEMGRKPVIDAKGNEGKRRDALPHTASVINKVCEHIFVKHNEGEETRAEFSARVWKRVDESMEIVRQAARDLLAGRVPIRFLIMSRQFSRLHYKKGVVMPHLEIIKRLRKRGEPLPVVGDRIAFVPIREPHDPRTGKPKKNSEMVEDPSYVMRNNIPVNYTYIFDAKFRKPMVNFYKYVLAERCRDAIMERNAFADPVTGERRYKIERADITDRMLSEETEAVLFGRRLARGTFLDRNEQTRYMGSTTVRKLRLTEDNSPLLRAINRQRKRKRAEVQNEARLSASFADLTRALTIARAHIAEGRTEDASPAPEARPAETIEGRMEDDFEERAGEDASPAPEARPAETAESAQVTLNTAIEQLTQKVSGMKLEHEKVMGTCRKHVGAHEVFCDNYSCPNFEPRVAIPGRVERVQNDLEFLREVRDAPNIEDLAKPRAKQADAGAGAGRPKMAGYFDRMKARQREARARQRKRQKKKQEGGEGPEPAKKAGLVAHFHQTARRRSAAAANNRKRCDKKATGALSNYFRKLTKQPEAPLVDRDEAAVEAASSQ